MAWFRAVVTSQDTGKLSGRFVGLWMFSWPCFRGRSLHGVYSGLDTKRTAPLRSAFYSRVRPTRRALAASELHSPDPNPSVMMNPPYR